MFNRPVKTSFFLFVGVHILTEISYNTEMLSHYKLKSHSIIKLKEISKIIYGGEIIVHNQPETLGDIIKNARKKAEMTVEKLAEKVDRSDRYIYQIENEGQIPSFDVLYKLVRILSIPPDLIFYPEKPFKDSEVENLTRMLYTCSDRDIKIVKATVQALIDTAPSEQ